VKAPITSVRLTRVQIPLTMVYASSVYIMQTTERCVIELATESGVHGLGETWGTPEVFALAANLAKSWIGKDVLERHALRRAFWKNSFDPRTGRNGRAAFAGLDLAAWDAAGKLLGLSLAELIGARSRESIEVVTPLPAAVVAEPMPRAQLQAHMDDLKNTKRVVDFALEQHRRFGFTCLKYKSAAYSDTWDLAVLTQLREALPQARLRFDPNAGYAPAAAIELCAKLEPLALEFYEDPTGELEGIARLRAAMNTPVATNMWVVEDAHLAPAARRGAVDVILADLFNWGGVDAWCRMARAAPVFGMKPALHSIFETGIATVANLHLAAAMPHIQHANDSGLHFLAQDVLADSPAITNGHMRLPAGPGLGVALDRAKLDALAIESKEVRG
jgi:glucarate dehydratase